MALSEHAATVLPSPESSEDRTAYGDAEVALKALRELGISFLFQERSEDRLQGGPLGAVARAGARLSGGETR